MEPSFKRKPKGQLLGECPQRGGFWLFPSCSQPHSPSACLAVRPREGLPSFPPPLTTWLMSSVLAKVMMGNWDTMGLVSWGAADTQAPARNSRRLGLSPRLLGPSRLTVWAQGQGGVQPPQPHPGPTGPSRVVP